MNEYRRNEDKKIKNIYTGSAFHMLYGLSQQQFWYQERYEIIEQFNRNLELLKYISKQVKTKIDMESILQKVLGMSVDEYLFLAKPIVKTDKGRYIIHNSYLVLKILSDGLYWVIRNYYYDIKSQLFTNDFGIYFEKYVENLFEFYLNDISYFKLNEIKWKKISDLVIELDKYIIIIECEEKSNIES